MATNWKEQQQRVRRADRLPTHFCGECTALRDAADATCLDCGRQRPGYGWAPLDESLDPFLGRVLCERYLISKIEGWGSSSTIYRAESLAASRFLLNKRFAIKMVKLHHAGQDVGEELRARIEREVRAVGMLRNPHIVRVYEMVQLDRNFIALVMDHIEGDTVEQCIGADGPLEVERACALVRQVANGLYEAHEVGMIHRDIKPANLMIERLPDGRDFAYVLDFGVVRLEGESELTHGFLGTPLFASPEQATGKVLDARSDIYSLGATFFYMLTGRAPFESAHTLDVLRAHVKQPAPRLADVAGRAFPQPVERLVARMLAKTPEERPSNLLEVIAALRELDGDAPRVPEPTPGESADLTNGLAVEDTAAGAKRTVVADAGGDTPRGGATAAFQQRPKTATGLRHAPAALPEHVEVVEAELDSAEFARDRRDSAEVSAFRQTNPRGFQRPATNPKGVDSPRAIPVRKTVQFVPATPAARPRRPTPSGAQPGYAFARIVRASGASTDDLIAFVDAQNEVWALGQQRLEPLCTPLERVCSLRATRAGVYVGLTDGTINRVLAEQGELRTLFRDRQQRAIVALAATHSGDTLLAATADGALFLGRPARERERWMSMSASRGLVNVALTPMGEVFAAVSVDNFVRVATTKAPGTAIAKFGVDAGVEAMAFSNDGQLLAMLLRDGRLPVYHIDYGRKISELAPDCPRPQSLYFSRQNILYGVCAHDGRVGRWNLTTGRPA